MQLTAQVQVPKPLRGSLSVSPHHTSVTSDTDTVSIAAPLVDGVVAGFLPLPNHQHRAFLIYEGLFWKRPHGGQLVIWNRVDKLHNPLADTLGNTSSPGYENIFSNSSAADWPDTSLARVPLDLGQTAEA